MWYNQVVIRIICPIDNTPFYTYPSKLKQGRGKYCSVKCSLTVTSIKTNIATQFVKGQIAHNFKGWRYCGRNNKYIEVWITGIGYRRQHRIVMEQYLGRKLKQIEEVHHIDGNGHNNSITNLQLMPSKKAHLQLEHANGKYSKHLSELHKSNQIH